MPRLKPPPLVAISAPSTSLLPVPPAEPLPLPDPPTELRPPPPQFLLERSKTSTYSPPPLQHISPLADGSILQRYSVKHPKADAPKLHPQRGLADQPELTPLQAALHVSPYARVLSTPVRIDVEFQRRLPSFLLLPFGVRQHPTTGGKVVVPLLNDDRPDNKIPEEPQQGWQRMRVGKKGYALCYEPVLAYTTGQRKGRWRRLADEQVRAEKSLTLFTNDSASWWRSALTERCAKEVVTPNLGRKDLVRVRQGESIEAALEAKAQELGEAKMGLVGCLLDFREAGKKEDGDGEKSGAQGQPEEDGEEEEAPPEPCAQLIQGKLVPLHAMRKMLGDEGTQKVRGRWRLEEDVQYVVVLSTERTVNLQMWLMRMRAYLGIWHAV